MWQRAISGGGNFVTHLEQMSFTNGQWNEIAVDFVPKWCHILFRYNNNWGDAMLWEYDIENGHLYRSYIRGSDGAWQKRIDNDSNIGVVFKVEGNSVFYKPSAAAYAQQSIVAVLGIK